MMKALELDFCRDAAASRWAGRLLLVVAMLFAAHVGLTYHDARDSIERNATRLAELGGPAAAARRVSARQQNVTPEELAFARETIARLSLPWGNLFGALESASTDRVALLAIEPDRESGTVLIVGESRDYLAALNYVLELRRAKALTNVHLAKHEVRPNLAPNPVAFSVSARWKEAGP
jgi:hypothetical protein